jgi:hypothetical protein
MPMKRRYIVVGVVVLLFGVGGLTAWLVSPGLASGVEERGGKVIVEDDTPEGRVVSIVFIARPIGDSDLTCLRDLRGYQRLFLDSTRVQGAALANLAGSDDLRWVSLGGSPVTDDGLKNLPLLPRLELLNLNYTRVTDAGLAQVAKQKSLRHLFLMRTAVTDAGLEHLKGLDQLEELLAPDTKLTEAGIRRLQESIPKLTKVQIGKAEE